MACFSPIDGYRTPSGTVSMKFKEGYSDRTLKIACGRCQGCRLDRAHAWAVRCMHEVQTYAEEGRGSSFITLTYSDAHVPQDGSVRVRDWQLFAKSLRKRCGDFRYFHCGEYGEANNRPHYHAILFGLDFADERIPIGANAQGDRLYLAPTLEDVWGKGITKLGNVTFSSAAYVARYAMKKIGSDTGASEQKYWDRYGRYEPSTGLTWTVSPEYCTMSRRPGIGYRWFMKYGTDVFPGDELRHDGRVVKTPRYYDRLMEERFPEVLESVKARRVVRARRFRSEVTPDRLAVREEVARLKAQKKGNL